MDVLNFKHIGDKIRKRRNELYIKQEYLAEKLNVNPSHISNVEWERALP